MTSVYRFSIALAVVAFAALLGSSLLLANRRIDVTFQKSVAFSSPTGAQSAAGMRVDFQHDAYGYRLMKQGWVRESFDGQQLAGDAAFAVDSRR